MKERHIHTLVVGSGAAGLASALRLETLGVAPLAVYTEGLAMGTSINAGSDKQTYYKLGMYGDEADSPICMARDLARGGAVHGDIALAEAATSPAGFFFLTGLGVPFPHDHYGQYAGYKTDHDPRRRATSCGPYTSREMCRKMIVELRRREIEVVEHRVLIRLLVAENRCFGGIFADTDAPANSECFETVYAENTVFAVGGPGGLYADSVYPKGHTGAIGVALEAGAKARNLPESQFGLASIQFRWNVSGSYMQVLPRFVSTAPDGSEEREFLRESFDSIEEMYNLIFLKGYQWPFAAGHVPGSSLIDILVHRETKERGRRVFLDYRTDPADLKIDALSEECREYLTHSGALGRTPLARLEKLNAPAIELYREHQIDLASEMLEIAVCAQHNNGGLAADAFWQSENIAGLFPVGEVNGSHGVTRPGGTALNAGQCGALRAAEWIAAHKSEKHAPDKLLSALLEEVRPGTQTSCRCDWRRDCAALQERMSRVGGFLRERHSITVALAENAAARRCYAIAFPSGLSGREYAQLWRTRSLLFAEKTYLEAILFTIDSKVGSRGGAAILDSKGECIHPRLRCRMVPENPEFRKQVLETLPRSEGESVSSWQAARPVPVPDGWFETIWREYRDKEIYR
ncbi:MAG: FAD-binding protein [Victivallaceae bacterium]|nr:FAD-binding protein [Victivallaceae bacterium]